LDRERSFDEFERALDGSPAEKSEEQATVDPRHSQILALQASAAGNKAVASLLQSERDSHLHRQKEDPLPIRKLPWSPLRDPIPDSAKKWVGERLREFGEWARRHGPDPPHGPSPLRPFKKWLEKWARRNRKKRKEPKPKPGPPQQAEGESEEDAAKRKARHAWMSKRKLTYASRHPKVRELQTLLNDHGADPPVAVDQQFGPKTLRAVKRFQSGKELKPDGIVGQKTWAALGGTPELPTVYEQQRRKWEP
jgi:hypothetical protein